MGAPDPKWPRYITASIADVLHNKATAISLPLVVEGLNTRTRDWTSKPNKAEANIFGPNIRALSADVHYITVDLFIVISSFAQNNDYNHLDLGGQMLTAVDQVINVKTLGEVTENDVGCLHPLSGPQDQITLQLLRAADSDQILHSVINARYHGYFPSVAS